MLITVITVYIQTLFNEFNDISYNILRLQNLSFLIFFNMVYHYFILFVI